MKEDNLVIDLTEEYPYCKFIKDFTGIKWCISDTEDCTKHLMFISAEKYSLSQAIEMFEKEIKN